MPNTKHTESSFPPDLIQALNHQRLIPFVGAGVSMSVKKAGTDTSLYPSWETLLKNSATTIREHGLKESAAQLILAHLDHAEDDSYLQAAKLAKDTLGNLKWNNFLKDQLDFSKEDCSPESLSVAEAIWSLNPKLLITTNYDKVLDWACPDKHKSDLEHWDIESTHDQASFLAGDLKRPTIWHLHGRISNVEKLILTPGGYKQLYGDQSSQEQYKAALRTLQTLFTTHTLLFIGFSFSDPVFASALKEISDCFNGNSNNHFILIKESQKASIEAFDLPLTPITYKDHADLPNVLEAITECATVRNQTSIEKASAEQINQPFSPSNRIFNLPYRQKGDGVVGRESVLQDLRKQLTSGRPTSIGHAAAFRGMGGLGKTQLAIEYAYRFKDEYPKGVFWLFADQDIDSQLVEAAERAKWFSPLLEPADKLSIARKQLKSSSDRLIIFDNVESLEQIKEYLPEVDATPHVLITSRIDIKGFNSLPLNLLTSDESVELLLKEAQRDDLTVPEQTDCHDIASTLGHLPLAIELAGAYLRKFPSITFSKYKSLLRSNLPQALTDKYIDSLTDHTSGLFSTLALTEQEISQSPLLEDIVRLLSFSASASMGASLMSHLLNVSEEELIEPLALGVELRLLSMEEDERYSIHRLLKEIQNHLHPIENHLDWGKDICTRLAVWFQERREDFEHLKDYQAEIDHLEHWQASARLHNWSQAIKLLWLQAYPLWHLGQYLQCSDILGLALELLKEQHFSLESEKKEIEANLLNDLGSICRNLGQYNKALEYNENALVLRQALFGEQHPDVATSYNNVGSTYGELGQHNKALEYEEKALVLRQALFGEQHTDVAASYNNVGGTYGELGQHNKALEYKEKALLLVRVLFGERHPSVAVSYNNVGGTYGELGQHNKALEYKEKALELKQALFDGQHPDVATSYNNVGGTYGKLGQHNKALEYKEKALVLMQVLFGEQHPHVAVSYNNIGGTYGELGQHNKALEYKEKALALWKGFLGERHPYVATSYNNVGSTYGELGQHNKALEYEEKALALRKTLFGEQHPDVAASYNNVGSTVQPI